SAVLTRSWYACRLALFSVWRACVPPRCSVVLSFCWPPRPPCSTLLPYTTLFRSVLVLGHRSEVETGVPKVRDLRQRRFVLVFDRVEDRFLALLRISGAQSVLGHDMSRHARSVGTQPEFGLPVC